MKYKDYADLVNGLKDLPLTWYPALIFVMVKAAYKKRVFKPGGASHAIRILENKEGVSGG